MRPSVKLLRWVTEMITVDEDTLRAMLEQAYALGFAVSGEGWNAEYPFADKCNDYEDDEDWCDSRDRNIAALLAEITQQGEQA